MKISAETAAIILTIVIASVGATWAIRDAISASEERMNQRMESRITGMESRMNERMESRITGMETRINQRMDRSDERMDGIDKRLSEIHIAVTSNGVEIRRTQKYVAHHRHRTDGEVYYTSSIASAGNETETTARQGDAAKPRE